MFPTQGAKGDVWGVAEYTKPEPPDPFGDDPNRWDKLLELLRKGIYRGSTLARAMGVTKGAINKKRDRDPEWAIEFEKAKAVGEELLLNKIIDCDDKNWTRFAWLLERIHGYKSPADAAKLIAARQGKETREPIDPDERFI